MMPVVPTLDEIKVIVDQVAHAEGYGIPDAIPTDANNPCDLMLGKRFPDCVRMHKGKAYTAVINGITIFPKANRNADINDPEDGFAAGWRFWTQIFEGKSEFYHPGMSIQDVADLWTTTDPSAWAKRVADGLGADVTTRLSDLQIETV